MEVIYNAAGLDQLLNPKSPVWQQTQATSLKLEGTPAAMQPTAAIRETWADKKIGMVEKVNVQAIHNGNELAFRLEWDAPNHNVNHGDNSVFPDGAAIAFPAAANAPVMMGAPNMPINIWFWRASDDVATAGGEGRQINAEGIGTSDTIDKNIVKTNGSWENGKWSVVISRALIVESEKPAVKLASGQNAQFSVAIWDGSNKERGGIKSYTGMMWLELTLAGDK